MASRGPQVCLRYGSIRPCLLCYANRHDTLQYRSIVVYYNSDQMVKSPCGTKKNLNIMNKQNKGISSMFIFFILFFIDKREMDFRIFLNFFFFYIYVKKNVLNFLFHYFVPLGYLASGGEQLLVQNTALMFCSMVYFYHTSITPCNSSYNMAGLGAIIRPLDSMPSVRHSAIGGWVWVIR